MKGGRPRPIPDPPKQSFAKCVPKPELGNEGEPIRIRIKGHRRIRAGDLIPHELNLRLHPDLQRSALEALYQDVGFARSLLAYELPDGRLKLLDGHLRRDIDPDMEVRNPGRERRRSPDAALEHRSPGGTGGNAASAPRPVDGGRADAAAGIAG